MKSKKETFAEVMQSFSYRYDLRTVFDDFLTIAICAVSQNLVTRKSYDEDLYMATIAKYEKEDVQTRFPKLFASLILEMEERVDSSLGNDVVGEFYEKNLYSKGAAQYFTPWPICQLMAQCVSGGGVQTSERMRIIDTSCGSGRMLLAGAKSFGKDHSYYGIDVDSTCVKMTAINLFFNGIFHSEVMCGDALSPGDFRMSYVISFLPIGIFRIESKEQSLLWQMHNQSFRREQKPAPPDIKLPSESETQTGKGSQLQLF